MNSSNIEEIISILEKGDVLPEPQVIKLLLDVMPQLHLEPNVLQLSSPMVIVGDVHGQLDDLIYLFSVAGDNPEQKYIFLGDYVDRGYHSLNTFLLLVARKLKNRDKYYLLRGNHESRQVSQLYGLYNECLMNYGNPGVWALCNNVFDLLPLAGIIDEKIFCVHGGISPNLPMVEMMGCPSRNHELAHTGSLCDLCWGDPDDGVVTWLRNPRGAGFLFGANHVKEFLHNNKLSLVVRSHQIAMEGFKWFFDNQLITVWSAPNYAYRSDNVASIMKYNFDSADPFLIKTFNPAPDRIVPPEEDQVMNYFA